MTNTAQVEGPSAPALARQEEIPTRAQSLVRRVASDQFKQQVRMALPPEVPVDRFTRAMITVVLANPGIAEADPDTIFNSLLRCAQDGLLPDGNEAALVIYNSKVKQGGKDVWIKKAQYIPMIGGYRKIAAEHGWSLRGNVVYAADEFEYDPTGLAEVSLMHRAPKLGTDRGEMVGAYAVARHLDANGVIDRVEHLVMSADEIEKVRAASKAKDAGPWKDWTERMYEKTPARRLFKQLPLDPKDAERVKRVFDADEIDTSATVATLYGSNAGELAAGPTVSEPEPKAQPRDGAPAASVAESPAPAAATAEPGSGSEKTGAAPEGDAASSRPPTEEASSPPGDPSAAAGDLSAEPVIEGVVVAETTDDEPETEPEADPLALTEQEQQALPQALEIKIPGGSYQGRSIGWVLDLGDRADEWLAYALRQPWPHDQAFQVSLTLACKAQRPELYKAWMEASDGR